MDFSTPPFEDAKMSARPEPIEVATEAETEGLTTVSLLPDYTESEFMPSSAVSEAFSEWAGCKQGYPATNTGLLPKNTMSGLPPSTAVSELILNYYTRRSARL